MTSGVRVRMLAALTLVATAGCPRADTPNTATPGGGTGPSRERPRLVVLLVIDQLPQWAFVQKRPHLTGGFDRLLREGEWHTGRHPTPATLTAPGHALIGTGEPPSASGILANEWWDRTVEKSVKSVDDPAGGMSAVRLRVPGLGDAVAAASTGARAVSVSLKDRAAILPLGHAGTPIWYDRQAIAFRSLQPLPWLAEHTAAHPIAPRLQEPWTPLDAERLATLSGVRDDQRGEVGEKGFGPTFPHVPAATKNPADSLYSLPLGADLIFDVATAALDGEQLGRDATPDLLVLSISPHDYVGHGWGHESWEAWDLVLRLDDRLERFLATLDAKVGADRWALVLTSDHGASPLPERIGGGRITFESLADAANRAAIAELGPGNWVGSAQYPYVFLTAAARAQPPTARAVALKKVMFALRAFPGIEQVGLTADFAGDCDKRSDHAAAICRMIDPERAGEVFYLPRRGWVFEEEDERLATAHGSFHDYDRDVPLVLVSAGRRRHPPAMQPTTKLVPMTEVSTLVATWLGVTPPRALPRQRQP